MGEERFSCSSRSPSKSYRPYRHFTGEAVKVDATPNSNSPVPVPVPVPVPLPVPVPVPVTVTGTGSAVSLVGITSADVDET
jgi:hypothetical protein